ncbi:sensor domain-containing diguanylate cyclase [Paraburkholderia sp. IMGN_8]|uniref:sensor domain-containing diguanylate cyclase n=1 Tax=Paraburkholderia sp. IMGN_8 TaxID=3136564 RepID=UPI0031018509
MRLSLPFFIRSPHSAIPRILSPVGVVVGAVLLALFMCLVTSWVLLESRADAHSRAEENARNLVLVIDRDISRTIELYDLSLQAVVDGTADQQVMALPPALRSKLLFDRAATGKYLGSIFVLDEHGSVALDSKSTVPPTGNFSDRDYFLVHRSSAEAGLYVSKPYGSRLRNGALTIALSRRVTRPDGTFGGIVVGTLSIDYFRALLDGLAVGKHGTSAVFEANGSMITRLPYDPALVGRDIRNAPAFAKAMSAPQGAFAETASIDGVRRLYVYKHLSGLPIIVAVEPAEADIYAEWQRRARRIAALVLGFTIVLIIGSMLLAGELGQRRIAESELQRLAHTDALTGLNNRGTFDETLQLEWHRAARTGRELSLLFVDIDQFKAYNDYYGHPAGDVVLKAVARCVLGCVSRPVDQVARYGGEEFVVTLPDMGAAGAMYVAEKVRNAVYDLGIEHAQSHYGRVTASIGVVSSRNRTFDEGTALLDMADSALYRAKSAGRNRVCEAERV